MTSAAERVLALYAQCVLAEQQDTDADREHVMRAGLVTQAINEADIPEDVRDDLLLTAAQMPQMARQALGGWVRDVIAYQDDLGERAA